MSNEWLTTGQMIDRLKVGEKAQDENNKFEVVNIKGHIRYSHASGNGDCQGDYFRLTPKTKNLEWRILPDYVSFEEAMKALKEGKTVTSHTDDWNKSFNINKSDSLVGNQLHIGIGYITDGKWTIEADTQ